MRRSIVCILSLVLLMMLLLVPAPFEVSARTDRLWTDPEFQRGRELSKEFLKTGVPFLKKQKTLHARPPFYKGPLPLTYSVGEAGIPGLSVTFTMDFGEWHNEFIYLDLNKANYILANGARATDGKTGRVLAEAKLIEPFIGTPKPLIVEERHFGEDGKVLFRSKSSFEKSNGFKISEGETTGTKVRDYFLLWPIGR